MPKGYEAYIFPSPKASSTGLLAHAEPFVHDPRLARHSSTTIMLEASNHIGSMYFKANDYLYVPKGHALAIIKFVKRE